jgi:cell division protein FtsB
VVLLLAVGLLAGCSARSSSTQDSAGGSAAQAPAGSGAQKAPDGAAAAVVDRQVVTTGTVRIVVAKPAEAAERAVTVVEAAGGRVDERIEKAASDERQASAQLVVRIPAAHLTGTLDKLKGLGKVDEVQLTATDVTAQGQDLDARIDALKASVARLETLMGTAASSRDLLAIESELSTRQADLEALQAKRTGLAGQVALATITLDLVPRAAVTKAGGPNGFWPGVMAGWKVLLVTLRGLVIAVGVLLPWAAFLGLVTAAVVWLVRLVRRRRPVRGPLQAAPPGTLPPAAPPVAPPVVQG